MSDKVKERILILEAYYGGSHQQLCNFITSLLRDKAIDYDLIAMTDKKWHWRSRTSALYFAQNIPTNGNYRSLFVSSTTNLAELLGLRPDLIGVHKVIYFHENQLIYPVQKHQDRDFQYGYNQIISCLVADMVFFNSQYNMMSFLSNINKYCKTMPDYRPKNIEELISNKCNVLYFPLGISPHQFIENMEMEGVSKPLHIVWAHRWEHDKNPASFFKSVLQLHAEGFSFILSVLGQTYTDTPEIFNESKEVLQKHVKYWGFQETKEKYIEILKEADVAVSTANHEFFGVAMLEAVIYGCFPICPNRLVYPEIFPDEYLYNTDQQLYKKLRSFCKKPSLARNNHLKIDLTRFDAEILKEKYLDIMIPS